MLSLTVGIHPVRDRTRKTARDGLIVDYVRRAPAAGKIYRLMLEDHPPLIIEVVQDQQPPVSPIESSAIKGAGHDVKELFETMAILRQRRSALVRGTVASKTTNAKVDQMIH
jgi:hypothetical protein